ncbi:MAG: hypothetical protein AAF429_14580 [Pseudomonadota bacterium]
MAKSEQSVKKRKVFYFPGYDPKPPRRYREIYRAEAQKQGDISGYQIGISAQKTEKGRYAWNVDAQFGRQKVHTDYEFMTWTDIVKDSMEGSILKSYWVFLRTGWRYFFSGAWGAYRRLGRPPFIVTLYPFLILGAQLVIALIAWALCGVLLGLFAPKWIGWLLGAVAFVLTLRYFKSIDHRVYAHYLMYDYGYAVSAGGEYPAELVERLKVFTQQIIDASQEDYDEILIVGHSSGANVGISALAEALRNKDLGSKAQISLLTLGHVVPLISYLPKAWEIRRDMQYLSAHDGIAWIDFTAPTDAVCFAFVDPVATTGVEPKNRLWPIMLSAQFKASIAPERFEALRKKYFQIHIQYLCAFEMPKHYEYFLLTAGPTTLGQRYAGYDHTPQRIYERHSPHWNTAP